MLFYSPTISEGVFALDTDESRHISKVLRFGPGDPIEITDGKGSLYHSKITNLTSQRCTFKILERSLHTRREHSIHIVIAPTKNSERIEWFAEKATEIGIEEISFMRCENSERKTINLDRILKKTISALKQSGQVWLPQINSIQPFEYYLHCQQDAFIAHVDKDNPLLLAKVAKPKSSYRVLIGPEGDFTDNEIKLATQRGFQKVSLGPTRLRTETAGLVACHTLNEINLCLP